MYRNRCSPPTSLRRTSRRPKYVVIDAAPLAIAILGLPQINSLVRFPPTGSELGSHRALWSDKRIHTKSLMPSNRNRKS
jgi:hypothetical protein